MRSPRQPDASSRTSPVAGAAPPPQEKGEGGPRRVTARHVSARTLPPARSTAATASGFASRTARLVKTHTGMRGWARSRRPAMAISSSEESWGDPRAMRSASWPSVYSLRVASRSSAVTRTVGSRFVLARRHSGVTPSRWNIPQLPAEARAAPNHLRSASEARNPRTYGRPSPARSPRKRRRRSNPIPEGSASTSTRIVGCRPSSRCRPKSGVAPTIAAARAEGPPSRFVRAPRTEFAKHVALDSAQATCSPRPGRTPCSYGVQEKIVLVPRAWSAGATRACFSAKASGIPSSRHWARSVPRGFTVVGTATRVPAAKSSMNSSHASPMSLYDAPETWAEVIGTRDSAPPISPRARRISMAFRWAGVPSSRRRPWSLVRFIHSPPARSAAATRRKASGFAGWAASLTRTSIASVSRTRTSRPRYASCLSNLMWRTPSSSSREPPSAPRASRIPEALHASQVCRIGADASTRRTIRTIGLPMWPSSASRRSSPAGSAAPRAARTRSSSSVAWAWTRASIQRIGRLAIEMLQDVAHGPPELREGTLVDEEDFRGRDRVPEPPSKLPLVPGYEGLSGRRRVGPVPPDHAPEPRARGRVDGEDDEPFPERTAVHVELRAPAKSVDEDAPTRDPRQGPLRPDPEAVLHPLLVGHPADRMVRRREAERAGLVPDDIPHPDDGEAQSAGDLHDFLFPRGRHPRDAHDDFRGRPRGPRTWTDSSAGDHGSSWGGTAGRHIRVSGSCVSPRRPDRPLDDARSRGPSLSRDGKRIESGVLFLRKSRYSYVP